MATLPPLRARKASTLSRVARKLRRWLITGLILVAPAYVTFVALRWLFHQLDQPLRYALASFTGYDIPGAGLVTTVLLLLAAGAVGSSFLIRGAVNGFETLLDRIPLVRTLYSGVKQLMAPLADEHGNTFQNVVMVRYPDHETYSLGFLIRREAGISPAGEPLSAVLIPTNHLHLGNVVLVASSRLHDVDLTAEQGLRFLVSMGAALDRPLELKARPPSGPPPARTDLLAPERAELEPSARG